MFLKKLVALFLVSQLVFCYSFSETSLKTYVITEPELIELKTIMREQEAELIEQALTINQLKNDNTLLKMDSENSTNQLEEARKELNELTKSLKKSNSANNWKMVKWFAIGFGAGGATALVIGLATANRR